MSSVIPVSSARRDDVKPLGTTTHQHHSDISTRDVHPVSSTLVDATSGPADKVDVFFLVIKYFFLLLSMVQLFASAYFLYNSQWTPDYSLVIVGKPNDCIACAN